MAVEQTSPSTPGAAHPHLAEAVYEQLPYALVVVDEQGGVLSANPAAIEMGWRSGEGEPPAFCHEMFACRRPW